ncbi:MAG: hypothetical protein IT532_05075 [Burkholderiales bacterium]|nr:hypothetical protein [Burkholderiales bacterium]
MRTFAIALLCAILAALIAAFGGDWATGLHRVSDFEGGRGMLIVFVLIPGAFLAAFILGVIVARRLRSRSFGYALGIAAAWTAGIAGAILALSWLGAPVTPTIDGHALELDIEVRLPAGRHAPKDAEDPFRVTVYSGSGENRHYATLHYDKVYPSEGRDVLPATGPINLRQGNRRLTVTIDDAEHYWFDLPLRAQPTAADETWIEWMPRPGERGTADVRGTGGFQVRYRIRRLPAGE